MFACSRRAAKAVFETHVRFAVQEFYEPGIGKPRGIRKRFSKYGKLTSKNT